MKLIIRVCIRHLALISVLLQHIVMSIVDWVLGVTTRFGNSIEYLGTDKGNILNNCSSANNTIGVF